MCFSRRFSGHLVSRLSCGGLCDPMTAVHPLPRFVTRLVLPVCRHAREGSSVAAGTERQSARGRFHGSSPRSRRIVAPAALGRGHPQRRAITDSPRPLCGRRLPQYRRTPGSRWRALWSHARGMLSRAPMRPSRGSLQCAPPRSPDATPGVAAATGSQGTA